MGLVPAVVAAAAHLTRQVIFLLMRRSVASLMGGITSARALGCSGEQISRFEDKRFDPAPKSEAARAVVCVSAQHCEEGREVDNIQGCYGGTPVAVLPSAAIGKRKDFGGTISPNGESNSRVRHNSVESPLGKGRKLCAQCGGVVGSPTRICPHCKAALCRREF